MRHFISITETPSDTLRRILERAEVLREQRRLGVANEPLLTGKTLALIFEKPSLRTRVSFEQAMLELGGAAIVLGQQEVGLGKRESPSDVVRVLAGMVHAVAARVFEHAKLTEMADCQVVPIINALSDYSHPCQALADILTLRDEFGPDLSGRTVAFIGDGNNVALSMAALCGKFGLRFILASPAGYELPQMDIDRIMSQCPDMTFELTHDPAQAMRHADAIYTDTWTSMGQEEEKQHRQAAFGPYQVNAKLVAQAPAHAIVLHCLPAYRGLEITADVMDGPQSRIFAQSHNRLHAQKGLLAELLA